ncbi:hypothetical protein DSECCO2_605380 [anaerobic digester metagenome]
MLGWPGAGPVLEVEPFQQQVAQAPARAVPGKAKGQIVDVEVAVVVGLAHFLGVLLQRVLGLQRAGKMQHQALERVRHVGVLVHAPVGLGEVVVDGLGNVEEGGLLLAQGAARFAVDDVPLGHRIQARFHQHLFHGVLHLLLLGNLAVRELQLHPVGDAPGE